MKSHLAPKGQLTMYLMQWDYLSITNKLGKNRHRKSSTQRLWTLIIQIGAIRLQGTSEVACNPTPA